MAGTDALTIAVPDGVTLEAELARPPSEVRGGAVMCHPHPQYGGSMRSIVISALFDALPDAGVTCLRFNFRGVEGSTGAFDSGEGERHDARAAVATLSDRLPSDMPLVLAGWSFGADVALSIVEPRLSAWVAIAPPLHFGRHDPGLPTDPRPKLLALAEHDEFRPPADVAAVVSSWVATRVEIVPGASHFFVGRTDRLVELVLGFVAGL
jgi:alpha/beta superfamily hydrolase